MRDTHDFRVVAKSLRERRPLDSADCVLHAIEEFFRVLWRAPSDLLEEVVEIFERG